MAKQSTLVMPSEPNRSRQKTMASHDTYKKAHAAYAQMDPAVLRAHKAAVNDVSDGLTAASQSQFSKRLDRVHYD